MSRNFNSKRQQYLEHAARWSGRKLETGTAEVINNGRLVGSKLIKGTGYGLKEVGKGIKELGSELSKLSKMAEPKNK